MAHIERYKIRADQFRHEEYETKAMEQVDHRWAEDISPDIVVTETTNTNTITVSNRVKIQQKLNSIIIDKVNFEKLDIAAVHPVPAGKKARSLILSTRASISSCASTRSRRLLRRPPCLALLPPRGLLLMSRRPIPSAAK